MLVSNSKQCATFRGEDGERLILHLQHGESAADSEVVEISLECDDHHFRTSLDRSETSQLREFLKFSYRDAKIGSVIFIGQKGEQLIFRHSNMGEPYREGIDVSIEDVKDFPDYLGPFVESFEARRMRDFITP